MSHRSLRFFSVVLVLSFACSKRNEEPAPTSQRPAEVVAPAGLVAELTVPDPRRFWASLRKLGGSRAEYFTSNFELGFFFAFGIPPRVAGFVRSDTPVVGVVLAPPGEDPALVVGVRTVRGAELVQELTRSGGGMRAERDGSPLTLLVGAPTEPPLGILDDWLVTSRDIKSLRAATAYLARTLGARPFPDAPLTLSVRRNALEARLAEAVKARWAALRAALEAQARDMQKERGRPADFAEPEAVLALGDRAVRSLVELFASSDRLTLVLRPEDDRLELLLTLTPRPDGELARSVAALEVGSLDPLLGLPETVIAVLSRSSDAERAASAENPADALRAVLGPRLSEKDAAPLADALRSFHRGRGSVTLFGMLAGGGAFVRQDVRDPKELERGVRGLFACCRLSVLAGPLESFVGKVGPPERAATIPGLEGPALKLRLDKFGPRGAPGELLIQIREKTAVAVAANDAKKSLVALTTTTESNDTRPAVEKLAASRPPAALALYADLSPLLLMRPGVGPTPALAVIGKRGADALLELALSAPACEAILERFGSP